MRKKKLVWVLLLCLLISILAMSALAADEIDTGTCGPEALWTLDSEGRLVISGSGTMDDFSSQERAPWYAHRSAIKSVEIGAGITSVGRSAFDGCSALVSVQTGDGVQSIGYHAFNRCASLRSVSFGKSVAKLDANAFTGCTALTTIRVSQENAVYSVSDGVLYSKDFSTLLFCPRGYSRALTVAAGCTAIADNAFQYCELLPSVTMPDSVRTIGKHAFDRCAKLVSAPLPANLETLEIFAFNECESLRGTDIPGGVQEIGNYAFFDCTSLGTAVFHPGLKKIGNQAFEGCEKLTAAILPDGVTTVGSGAFMGCTALEELYLPDSITTLGASALRGTGIRHLQVPKGVQVVESQLCQMCPNLESVSIPEGVQNVYSSAFYECLKLQKVFFPQSAKCYGLYAFYNCKALTDVYYSGTRQQWLDFSDHTSSYNDSLLHAPNLHFEHAHDYAQTASIEPTCEQAGKQTLCCECSDMQRTYLAPLGHDWGEWQVTVPATETSEGTETRVCKNNPTHTETRAIPKLAPEKCDGGANCASRAFTDVDRSTKSWSHEAIDWAVTKEITNGVSVDKFGPNEGCTRAQAVTFLWRAAGEPEPTKLDNPFTDVKEGAYYYKAVLWAVEQEITNGTAADKFSPNDTCVRCQIVTFLWRNAGKPAAASASAFADVPTSAYFAPAVSWAVEQGVTNGTAADKFSPNDTCTRAHIVTFLWRSLAQ